ncbi:MAG: thiamine phosphate synthase [Candidatus Omnitrophica bacterium]|nr:thiamine phosphate synthase [Candidatus Omnitrophota bacterium]MDD4012634.1 thiamine phosphate synthase [Candidatus Omnitrophota bacterium]
MRGYYFITGASLSKAGDISDVRKAVKARVSVIQMRAKGGDPEEIFRKARVLRKICRDSIFLVNDRVDIALSVGADGVHLGRGDMSLESARALLGPGKIIGVTVRSLEQAVQAEKEGADYIGAGPVFKTTTKTDAGEPLGIGFLGELKRTVSIPIAAIGGITPSNLPDVVEAGADLVCSIAPVVTSSDVEAEILKYQSLFRQVRPLRLLRTVRD